MIKLELSKMLNAIRRAKQVRPRVKWLGGRNYEVSGSQGNSYTVRFAVANGMKLAECNCAAGQASQMCFHVAASASVNIAIQSQRRQAMAA